MRVHADGIHQAYDDLYPHAGDVSKRSRGGTLLDRRLGGVLTAEGLLISEEQGGHSSMSA